MLFTHFIKLISENSRQTWQSARKRCKPMQLALVSTISLNGVRSIKSPTIESNGALNALCNCTNSISCARGQSSNECRDGVDTTASTSTPINVYLPDVNNEDLAIVRSALSATKDQLLYLPLKL